MPTLRGYPFSVVRFTLTPEHVALLRRANVSWEHCEFGAPSIDCKRPYGNSSVVSDILEILGEEPAGDEGGPEYPSDEQTARCTALHLETKTALQVILAAGTFEPGEYVADQYLDNWQRADG